MENMWASEISDIEMNIIMDEYVQSTNKFSERNPILITDSEDDLASETGESSTESNTDSSETGESSTESNTDSSEVGETSTDDGNSDSGSEIGDGEFIGRSVLFRLNEIYNG
jgi:hypothetical protein